MTYLLSGGLALLVAPRWALHLMFSNTDYGDVLPRFVGTLTVGLGVLVAQTFRLRLVALYPTLIAVRLFFCAGYAYLGATSRDPFFLFMLMLVGAGAVTSGVTWLGERRVRATPVS